MTLDAVHVDLGSAFLPGMGYVALSRARELKTLTLGGLNRTALMVSEEAAQIDETLHRATAKAVKQYKKLVKDYKSWQAEKPSRGAVEQGPWAKKLAKMREAYPNAYRPWKEDDDVYLQKQWNEKTSIESLSKKLGRHPGSIKKRLEKHYGEGVFENDE
jgi:ATP-dependent DNA helicase PIF1